MKIKLDKNGHKRIKLDEDRQVEELADLIGEYQRMVEAGILPEISLEEMIKVVEPGPPLPAPTRARSMHEAWEQKLAREARLERAHDRL